MKVALATSPEVSMLTEDDQLLAAELVRRGVDARPTVWDDARIPWSDYDRVVIRSCWDYHRRHAEFLVWLGELERAGVRVWNPPQLIAWNAHKSYLRDLAGAGVRVAPTVWIDQGQQASLRRLLSEQGWSDAVFKPAVSASAFRTCRVSSREADEPRVQNAFRALVEQGDVLVQPFLPQIETAGEWSVVFFAGKFSHAVLKRPAAGDFRVQSEFGGEVIDRPAPEPVIASARAAAAAIPGPWAYARIDGVDIDGSLTLMEMELIEPYLYLGSHPLAAARFADAVAADPR